ncbi:hypothetical protein [Paraburkholderia strydomiana]|uniref:hypothetical protein n=1 Tax=Paraburkholderia strydomiana TaxID=1245417 RepID=UPI001BECD27D|nr:hypothetical protein [Paraburkholderia strydomiana]MBT2790407.1 hypothetical protein [Paraburkholderia strydomiana]
MRTLSEELIRLRQADAHIADAIRRIELQRALIASMTTATDEKARAEALLSTMQATLDQFTAHRDAILESIQRLRR